MAIWQFSMHLVPKAEWLRAAADVEPSVTVDMLDRVQWWRATQPPSDLAERLSAVLPEGKHWHAGSRQWGADGGHEVSVSYANDRVDEVWARIDLRQRHPRLMEMLARLAADCSGWWVGGDTTRRVPIGETREAITSALAASDAARFVTDPRALLIELSERRKQGLE
jgi:hypothetical protein